MRVCKGPLCALTKCKCGIAPIIVETHLYENVKQEYILCIVCYDNAIDNEQHVFLISYAYDIRIDLFTSP